MNKAIMVANESNAREAGKRESNEEKRSTEE